MRRCGSIISSPLAAAALVLLLLVADRFHGTAAARLLPSSVPVPVQLVHQAENGVTTAAAGAADGGLVVQEGGVSNGEELSMSEMMGADQSEEEAAVACEESNEDCMQRRLLHEAHLDYIYTQHRGKP